MLGGDRIKETEMAYCAFHDKTFPDIAPRCPWCCEGFPNSERLIKMMKNPLEIAIDDLLGAIYDAAEGQEAWKEHGPYQLIIKRADELKKIAHKNRA